ncbi:MAG: hypothetical protein JEZ00_00225 [Anaerolineaceae bacterium]|nr:hypothetical protein [Anaerolineaceae bacterium]
MKAFINKYTPAIILLFLSTLAYGLMIPWLGFYWDDWPMAWFANTLGPAGFKEALAIDRPFLTGIYMLTTSLLPIKPIYWQVFALLSRWVCSLSVYWALTKIWPDLKKQMLWVSLLFAVFPGFKQQPIAIIYGNGFILLTSFFLSLGLMVKAINQTGRNKVFSIIASVFLQCFTIFSTEYYAGLEILRIFIIWYKHGLVIRSFKAWFLNMFREYFPYGIGLLFFIIWRVYIFKFPTYKPVSMAEFSGSEYPEIVTYVNRMAQDIYLTVWKTWSEIFQFPNLNNIHGSSNIFYWAVVILLIPLLIILLNQISKNTSISSQNNPKYQISQTQIIIFAIAAIILGALPFWITNLPIQLVYPYDRFFLSLMFGSSLLVVYLIERIFNGEITKIVVLSLLISFSIGSHIDNANSYRREWNVHNQFFWQLSWRVPALEENTMLLSDTFPLEFYSDNSLTAPLNWIYDSSDQHIPLKYMMVFTDIRLGGSLPDLNPGTEFYKNYRSTYFEGTTDQTVGFFYSTDACLRILDPKLSHDDPLIPKTMNEIITLSDPARILPAAHPEIELIDESIFGKEPEYSWCYYYEKADLARQYQDWQMVLDIEKLAAANMKSTQIGSEYLPFIEALAATGDWDKAFSYVHKAYDRNKNNEKLLCRELERYQSEYADTKSSMQAIETEMNIIGCADIIQ